jgi:hypothetical protein
MAAPDEDSGQHKPHPFNPLPEDRVSVESMSNTTKYFRGFQVAIPWALAGSFSLYVVGSMWLTQHDQGLAEINRDAKVVELEKAVDSRFDKVYEVMSENLTTIRTQIEKLSDKLDAPRQDPATYPNHR